MLGIPGWPLRIILVTDSQASINILKKCETIIGIKDVMSAEMDVALELAQQQQLQDAVEKVTSHIERDEAPDDSFWLVNDMVDMLATGARNKVLNGDLTPTCLDDFDGATAGCLQKGQLVTAPLKQAVHHALYGNTVISYLCIKYGWNEATFNSIDNGRLIPR